MPTMEQINEGYFNYLVNQIFKALDEANDYDCKDFCILKVEVMLKLNRILESKEKLDQVIELLKRDNK